MDHNYYLTDEQESVRYVLDAAGNVQNDYWYDAFGQRIAGHENILNRLRYNAQIEDDLMGLYYLRARYYNTDIGRFTQEDVIYNDGLNLYAYCSGNPVMYADPSGYACEPKEGAENAITDPSRLLGTTKNSQDHHIIPAFRGKSKPYADFIKKLGIDVDQYTITVSGGKGGMHMNFIHGKGKWNQKWMNFIDDHPNATAKDIYQFAGKMMDDYGLSGLQIHPYGK